MWGEPHMTNKTDYRCDSCGAVGQYTLTMERFKEYIWDGPYWPPVGENDQGSIVQAHCNICGEELDIAKEDFDRLYVPKKGVVFYDKSTN